MSYTYTYQTSMTASVRVYDKKIKKVGAIQSVQYYDPVNYYQRRFGSWPNKNFDSITVRFDGDGSDSIYHGESCSSLELESATAGSAYSKLVLWHDFEETAGTVIGDWKNNVHSENKPASAAATKSTSSVVGDRCLVFNGSSQYTLGGVTNMPTTKMSFAFWIKTTATAGTLISFGGGSSNNVERAVKLSAGKVQLFEKNGAAETSLLSSSTVNDDSWHQIVCTIAGISSVWKIYVDKVDVSASAVNGPGNTNLAVLQTTIAVSYVNALISNYYAGSIDDLRVYNEVLTQSEIDELYALKPFNGTQTSAYSNIISWYRIEETSGSTLADIKSANPATLYNTSFITFPSEGADSGSSSIKFDNTDMDSTAASQGFAQMGVAGLTATGPVSISLWVKASVTRNCVIWAFDADNYGTTTLFWWLDIRSSGKVTFLTRAGNNTDAISSSSTNNNNGSWHHVVAVKSGNTTSDTLKIYTDNALTGTVSLSATGGYNWAAWNDLKFGVSKHYNGNVPSRVYNWWAKDVQIDDVRIYGSALSTAQIAELYALAP